MNHTTETRSLHRKQQMWVYIIAGLFVCDFVLCGYIPSRQRLVSLQRVRVQQRQTIERAAAQSGELARLERRLREMEKAVESYALRVPMETTFGTFLKQVTGIMTDCHLVDQAILPGKEWKTNDLHGVPIHVACKGSLAGIFNFFTKVQSLDRLVRIEKVALENDADLTGQINVQVEAVIFEQEAKSRETERAAATNAAGGVSHGA